MEDISSFSHITQTFLRFTCCSKVIEYVRLMACVWSGCHLSRQPVWEHICDGFHFHYQTRHWLWPYRRHCLHGWWYHLALWWSPTLTSLWWLSHRSVYTVTACALLFSSVGNSISAFTLSAGYSRPCLPTCSNRGCWNRFGYFYPSWVLLQFCQLAYSGDWLLSVGTAVQDLLRPSLLLLVFVTASWSGLSGFSTTLKHALTRCTFCLVGVGGRSSMRRMVSVGGCVGLVVADTALGASFFIHSLPF